jgi:hypothetical protein
MAAMHSGPKKAMLQVSTMRYACEVVCLWDFGDHSTRTIYKDPVVDSLKML